MDLQTQKTTLTRFWKQYGITIDWTKVRIPPHHKGHIVYVPKGVTMKSILQDKITKKLSLYVRYGIDNISSQLVDVPKRRQSSYVFVVESLDYKSFKDVSNKEIPANFMTPLEGIITVLYFLFAKTELLPRQLFFHGLFKNNEVLFYEYRLGQHRLDTKDKNLVVYNIFGEITL